MRNAVPWRLLGLLSIVLLAGTVFPTLMSCSQVIPLPVPLEAEFDDTEDGSIRFISSSSEDYQTAFWTTLGAAEQNPFASVAVSVIKLGGYSQADMGVIFAYQNDNNFYLVSIDIEGNYSVKKRLDGSFQTLVAWNGSENLKTGYNTANIITIEQKTAGSFTISFNGGAEEPAINDSSFTGGRHGYFVWVADENHELFPVEVVFKTVE